MNRKDLAKVMAEGADISRANAEQALGALLEAISGALAREEKVSISGFGTFSVTRRAARQGRNPKTGETIAIPASKKPKFTPGKSLKESVR